MMRPLSRRDNGGSMTNWGMRLDDDLRERLELTAMLHHVSAAALARSLLAQALPTAQQARASTAQLTAVEPVGSR